MYERYCSARDLKGLKDADVVRGTGISHVVFSEWKKGKCNPNAVKLYKIASFLEVPIEYLLGESDEMAKEDDSTKTIAMYLTAYEDMKSKELLDKYWNLDADSRKMIDKMMDALSSSKKEMESGEVG